MNEYSLASVAVVMGTATFVYWHLTGWLWKYKSLNDQLVIHMKIVKDLQTDREKNLDRIKLKIEEMQSEINALNLKIGMKLK